METILITGSNGFIGPHIVEECLNSGYKVKCLDTIEISENQKFDGAEYINKDVFKLTNENFVDVDYIFHLAFITNIPNSISNPQDTTYGNIDMTVDILKKASKFKIKKFVFPSTASLYGKNPIPWSENMSPSPIEPYSWQKLSCEYLCKMWSNTYGVPSTILRLFQVFGENPRSDSALYKFINAKKSGQPITLTETTAQSSFRTARRDFIYVKDVAKAFIATIESTKTGGGEVLNIGSGKTTTMEEIANAIGGEVKFIPRRSFEVEAHLADLTKTESLIDWKYSVNVLDWLQSYSIR